MNHIQSFQLFESAKSIKTITTTLGLDDEVAQFCVSQNPKIAVWLASEIKRMDGGKLTPRSQAYYEQRMPAINRMLAVNNKPILNLRQEDFISLLTKSQMITSILDWAENPAVDRVNLRTMTWDEAIQKQREWHDSIRLAKDAKAIAIENEVGKVIYTYPDGYYWIDLQKQKCTDEAKAMGHCGVSTKGNLISLRSKTKEPHVTIDITPDSKVIAQIKGKNNTAPNEKYVKYILDFIIKAGVESIQYCGVGGDSDLDIFQGEVLQTLYRQTKIFCCTDKNLIQQYNKFVAIIEDAGISAYLKDNDDADYDESTWFLNRANKHHPETTDMDRFSMVDLHTAEMINQAKPANIPYEPWLIMCLMDIKKYREKLHMTKLLEAFTVYDRVEDLLESMYTYRNNVSVPPNIVKIIEDNRPRDSFHNRAYGGGDYEYD